MAESNLPTIPELLKKKRDGQEFSTEEINHIVESVCSGSMQNAQIGAMLMAVRLKDMTERETIDLTRAVVRSGEILKWPDSWKHLVVDKHSTGGVGDKVSLVLAPALAACGCKVPMISGRGLAHTGGTLDKLESIPGFQVSQSLERIREIVETVGCCIVSQSKTLVPADAILYANRDVTATVDSTPLIAASIVSKKVAEGLASLLLDVKLGRAAWSEDREFIENLAHTMVKVSQGQGVKTTALITDMNNPLGHMVGNSLEVVESIQCLQGNGPHSLTQLVAVQGGHLLFNVGLAGSVDEGTSKITKALTDGSALDKFGDMLKAQGVETSVVNKLLSPDSDPFDILPRASQTTDIITTANGYIELIDAMECAIVSNYLGAGRTSTESIIDPAVGLQILRHVGEKVEKGEVIIKVHHNGGLTEKHVLRLQKAISVSATSESSKNVVSQQSHLVLGVINE